MTHAEELLERHILQIELLHGGVDISRSLLHRVVSPLKLLQRVLGFFRIREGTDLVGGREGPDFGRRGFGNVVVRRFFDREGGRRRRRVCRAGAGDVGAQAWGGGFKDVRAIFESKILRVRGMRTKGRGPSLRTHSANEEDFFFRLPSHL